MLRPHTSLSAVALLLTVAPAAPVPKEKPDGTLYFPTRVGATWVYQDGPNERIETVTDVELIDSVTVVAVTPKGQSHPIMKVSVSSKGLYRVEEDGQKLNAPVFILKQPLKPGVTWTTRFGHLQKPFEGINRVVSAEWVEVPAGRFRAYRIDWKCEFEGSVYKLTSWYAAGVGLIKTESNGTVRMMLKSFSPGASRP